MTTQSRIAVLLTVALAAGCARLGERCNLDSDCKSGLICYQYTRTCERPCTDTSDCPEGKLCMCELDRECPAVDEDTPLDDVQGGACLPPADDADTDPDAAGDPTPDPTDAPSDPDALDLVEAPDLADVDCGSDGAPDILPDGGCEVPDTYPDPVLYMRLFKLGTDGHPGNGLDLDGNPSTCAPTGNCSGGVDNGLFGLGSLANDYLPGGANGAETHVLLELAGFNELGCPFTMNFFAGTLTTSYPSECPGTIPVDCCPAERTCDFSIPATGFDAECMSLSEMGGIWSLSGAMNGGPVPGVYYLMLSVVGLDILMPVHEARVVATVTSGSSGPERVQGIIGGYIRQTEFFAVFQAIPEEDFPFPGKAAVIELMQTLYDESLIINDRDMDGDTTPDAASMAIVFDSDPATISGVDG